MNRTPSLKFRIAAEWVTALPCSATRREERVRDAAELQICCTEEHPGSEARGIMQRQAISR